MIKIFTLKSDNGPHDIALTQCFTEDVQNIIGDHNLIFYDEVPEIIFFHLVTYVNHEGNEVRYAQIIREDDNDTMIFCTSCHQRAKRTSWEVDEDGFIVIHPLFKNPQCAKSASSNHQTPKETS